MRIPTSSGLGLKGENKMKNLSIYLKQYTEVAEDLARFDTMLSAYNHLSGYSYRQGGFDFDYKDICGTVMNVDGKPVLSNSFDVMHNGEFVCSILV